MSIEGTVVSAPGPADDPQGLQEEIERTREHLGQTVEALVAKVDVKARAQEEAGRLIGRLKGRAIEARQQATGRLTQARRQAADSRQQATVQGRHVRRQVAEATAGPRQQAASLGSSVADQVGPPVGAVADGVAKVTPEPVKRAAGNAAETVGRHRKPVLAGVGAIVAALLGWLLIQRRRRSA
jgi:hypothetical protein